MKQQRKVKPCIDKVNNRHENVVATEHLNLTGLLFPPVFLGSAFFLAFSCLGRNSLTLFWPFFYNRKGALSRVFTMFIVDLA